MSEAGDSGETLEIVSWSHPDKVAFLAVDSLPCEISPSTRREISSALCGDSTCECDGAWQVSCDEGEVRIAYVTFSGAVGLDIGARVPGDGGFVGESWARYSRR